MLPTLISEFILNDANPGLGLGACAWSGTEHHLKLKYSNIIENRRINTILRSVIPSEAYKTVEVFPSQQPNHLSYRALTGSLVLETFHT